MVNSGRYKVPKMRFNTRGLVASSLLLAVLAGPVTAFAGKDKDKEKRTVRVPEPSSFVLTLVGVGVITVGLLCRRNIRGLARHRS
jgi:PEP-CTERM motif